MLAVPEVTVKCWFVQERHLSGIAWHPCVTLAVHQGVPLCHACKAAALLAIPVPHLDTCDLEVQ